MLDSVTIETFTPHIGDTFAVARQDGEALALLLHSVTPLGAENTVPGTTRRPFSLIFLGPRTPPLPQQIYRLSHETLGTLDLFIVPIGATASNVQYEAIFA